MKRIFCVLLSVMMILSTASFALPSAVTLQDSVKEFVSKAYAEDASLLSEDKWWDAEKGIKLFVVDFETKNDGTAITASDYSSIGNGKLSSGDSYGVSISSIGRINPELAESVTSDYRMSFYGSSDEPYSVTVADDNGNGYLSVKEDTGYFSMFLRGFNDGAGTYTFDFDYKYSKNGSSVNHSRLYLHTLGTDYGTLSNGDVVSVSHSTTNSLTFLRYVFYGDSAFTGNEEFCFDNFAVYYKPNGWTAPEEEGGNDDETDNEWTHETYGDLIFDLDFDKNNAGSAVASSTVGVISGTDAANKVLLSSVGKINPAYAPSTDTWSLFGYTMESGTAALGTDTDHGSYLTAKTASANASFYIEGANGSGRTNYTPAFAGIGTYTIEYDYKISGTSSISMNPRFHEFDNSADFAGAVGQWNHVVYTLDAAKVTQGVGSIRLRMITAAGAEVCFDNIRLYYSAPKQDEEETDETWTHDTYGTKLFTIDFETKNDGSALTSSDYSSITNGRLDNSPTSAGVLISSVGRLNPSLAAGFADNYRVNIKDASSATVSAVDGDNTLTVNGSNVSLFIGGVFDRAGAYTLEINYKYSDGGSGVAMNCINVRPQNIDLYDYVSGGNWVNFPYAYEYASGTADYFRYIFYSKSGATGAEKIYLDDISVYYFEPDENAVKVTLSANGNSDVSDVTVTNVSTNKGVDVATLISRINTSSTTRTLLGLSETPAGALLSGTFIPTGDTTLYMIWKNEITEETGSIIDEYSIEFEYDESSGNEVYWSNKGYIGSSTALTIPSTYSRNTDGHGVFTFKGAGSESGVWDSNIVLGSVTGDNPIPSGLVKGIAIKMRYRNIPTFTCSCKESEISHKFKYYKSGSYNEVTYSNADHSMQLFYTTPEMTGYSSSKSSYKSMNLTQSPYKDGWFTLYYDFSANADFQENTITGIRIDFSNAMWNGMIIDIDYIRFIGEPSKAPEQVDVDAIKTTKPVGYRFMASLTKELVSEATSYGWIIAREASLKKASITNLSFTYERAAAKNVAVLRGTNFGEGREEALKFNEDDANVYFTAMLYNIPSGMYEDVLVARPFAVIDGVTHYGKPLAKSIYDVALAIKESGFSGCSAAQQTYIQRIIDKVENE